MTAGVARNTTHSSVVAGARRPWGEPADVARPLALGEWQERIFHRYGDQRRRRPNHQSAMRIWANPALRSQIVVIDLRHSVAP